MRPRVMDEDKSHNNKNKAKASSLKAKSQGQIKASKIDPKARHEPRLSLTSLLDCGVLD